MKELGLSLKLSDMERKELKGRFLFSISLTSRLSRWYFLSFMRTDRSVIFRLWMLLLLMPADQSWSSSCERVVLSDLTQHYWCAVPSPGGGSSAAAKHKQNRCNTDDSMVGFSKSILANSNRILNPPNAMMTEMNSIWRSVFPLHLWIHFAFLIFLMLSPQRAFLFLLFQFCDCFSFPYLWLSISFSHCSVANLLTPSFPLPFSTLSFSMMWTVPFLARPNCNSVSFHLWEIWNIKTNNSLLHSQ